MRKLFKWQLILSGAFIVDCAGAPLLHIPLPFMVALYLGAIAESIDLAYLLKAFKKKWLKRKTE